MGGRMDGKEKVGVDKDQVWGDKGPCRTHGGCGPVISYWREAETGLSVQVKPTDNFFDTLPHNQKSKRVFCCFFFKTYVSRRTSALGTN